MKNFLVLFAMLSSYAFSQGGYWIPPEKNKKPSNMSKAFKSLNDSRAKVNAKQLYELLYDVQADQYCFGQSDDHIDTKKVSALSCKKTTIDYKSTYTCELTKNVNQEELYQFVSEHNQAIKDYNQARLPGNTITCKQSVSYYGRGYNCYLGGQKIDIRFGI